MTGKFSSAEFVESRDRLSPSLETLNRNGPQTAQTLVDSAKDYVYRCLNSDVDSVFALLTLLKNKEVIACSKLLTVLVDAVRSASYAHQRGNGLAQEDLDYVADLLDEILVVGKGKRDLLTGQLDDHIGKMVRKNVGSMGGVLTGPSAASAKLTIITAADRVFFSLPSIRTSADSFARAINNYHHAGFEDVSAYVQTRTALLSLEGALAGALDTQTALLDSAVATSLVKNASKPKLDIRLPKYEGSVTLLPETAPEIFGGTDPFIVTSLDSFVEASAKEDTTLMITVPPSKAPITDVGHEYTKSESGFLVEGLDADGAPSRTVGTVLHDGTTIHSGGVSMVTPKVPIVPGTFRIILTVKDIVTGEITSYEAIDQTDGLYYDGINSQGSINLFSDPTRNIGQVHYHTGKVELDVAILCGEDQFLDGSVYCTYQYRTIGTLLNWSETETEHIEWFFDNTTTFNRFSLVCGNYLYEATLDSPRQVDEVSGEAFPTNVTSPGDLRNLLAAASWIMYDDLGAAVDTESPVTFSVVDGKVRIEASDSYIGSVNTIRFPTKTPVSANTAFGSPRYLSPNPSYLNSILTLTSGDISGTDSPFSQAVISDTEKTGDVTTVAGKVSTTSYTTQYRWHEGKILLEDFPVGSTIGDDVYEVNEGWHTKIRSFVEIDADTSLPELFPQPPLRLEESVDYEHSVPCLVRITRNRPRISPADNESVGAITIVQEGLGFTGSVLGASTKVSLTPKAGLTGAATALGYNIKKRDVVYEKIAKDHYREIGRVGSVAGTTITVVINEGVSYKYPFSDFRVQSLGLHKHNQLKTDLIKHNTSLKSLVVSDYRKLCNTFATSGSAHAQFIQQTLGLISTISSLRNTYLKYDSHVVNTVNMLLEYLKQEKLTVVSDLLLDAQYAKIPDLTPQEVAGQGDVEAMLEQAAALYGSTTELIETRMGFNPLTDFVNRGTEANVDLGSPKQDFSRRND